MKKTDYVRFLLTILLLIFVWLDHQWAIKLCITLSAIGCEVMGLALRFQFERDNKILKNNPFVKLFKSTGI